MRGVLPTCDGGSTSVIQLRCARKTSMFSLSLSLSLFLSLSTFFTIFFLSRFRLSYLLSTSIPLLPALSQTLKLNTNPRPPTLSPAHHTHARNTHAYTHTYVTLSSFTTYTQRHRQVGRLTANHVLLLVCDAPAAPFSLQRMARLGQVEMGIPAGEWYGPAKASHLLKKLNGMFQTGVEQKLYTSKLLNLERRGRLHFLVYMDGVIHEQRVNAIFEQDKRASIAIFIPLRLGLDCVNEVYLKDLISIFSWKQFAGILGGRPKSSYFIIGAKVQADGNPSTASALYLDPHVPQPACVGPFAQRGQGKKGIDVSSYHCDYIQDMPISAIDPSMSLCFFVRNEEEASDLFSKLKEISADDREEVCDDVEKEGVESLGMEEKEEAKKEKENGGEEVVKQKGKKGRKGSRNASAQDGADSEKGERKKGEESKKPTTRKCTPFPIMVTAEIEDISDVASLDEDILSEDDEFVVL
mmetsp:Transcript_39974/g.103180  ORF Transcript_39974/g.103180 Transcript_39974/m.103180 type:complete len:468 (-) Transcript_39974:345-1748(-)